MLKALEILKKIKEGNFTPYTNENLIKIDEAIIELESYLEKVAMLCLDHYIALESIEMLRTTNKKPKEESIKKQSFQPYVDETVEPCESYLVFCENHSPWDEEEKNMVRVHSNAESHKMLEILEKHFGIKNLHKKEHNEPK
ncbi:hypothetical protein [Aliarcobacter butzleri]|uniref:hypothetical protein n=1 Tax=Aliarcobacter butzleri TaxID=28197 RepID=UPI0021B592AE|nr:hypothetical protein [Aliarcobacter butzleri]MCT7643878.1 hypothetical protein [Aliarcobacter butzleri]